MDSFCFDLDFLNDINLASQIYSPSRAQTLEESNAIFEHGNIIKPEHPHSDVINVQELSLKLTQHNEMVKEIERLHKENEILKKQSTSLNESAENVRIMYQNEHKLLEEARHKNRKLSKELNLLKTRFENLEQSMESNKYIHEQAKAVWEEKCKNLNELIVNLIEYSFDATKQMSDNQILGTTKKKELMNIKCKLLKHNFEVPDTKNLKHKNMKLKNTIKTEKLNDVKVENFEKEVKYDWCKTPANIFFTSPIKISYSAPLVNSKVDKGTQYVSSSVTRAINTDSKMMHHISVNFPERGVINQEYSQSKIESNKNKSNPELNSRQENLNDKSATQKSNIFEEDDNIMALWKLLGDKIFSTIKKYDNTLLEYLNNRVEFLHQVLKNQKEKEEKKSTLFYLDRESNAISPTSDYSETQLSGESIDDLLHLKPEVFIEDSQLHNKSCSKLFSLLNDEIDNSFSKSKKTTDSVSSVPFSESIDSIANNHNINHNNKNAIKKSKVLRKVTGNLEMDLKKTNPNDSETESNKDLFKHISPHKRLHFNLSDSSDEEEHLEKVLKVQLDNKTQNISCLVEEEYNIKKNYYLNKHPAYTNKSEIKRTVCSKGVIDGCSKPYWLKEKLGQKNVLKNIESNTAKNVNSSNKIGLTNNDPEFLNSIFSETDESSKRNPSATTEKSSNSIFSPPLNKETKITLDTSMRTLFTNNSAKNSKGVIDGCSKPYWLKEKLGQKNVLKNIESNTAKNVNSSNKIGLTNNDPEFLNSIFSETDESSKRNPSATTEKSSNSIFSPPLNKETKITLDTSMRTLFTNNSAKNSTQTKDLIKQDKTRDTNDHQVSVQNDIISEISESTPNNILTDNGNDGSSFIKDYSNEDIKSNLESTALLKYDTSIIHIDSRENDGSSFIKNDSNEDIKSNSVSTVLLKYGTSITNIDCKSNKITLSDCLSDSGTSDSSLDSEDSSSSDSSNSEIFKASLSKRNLSNSLENSKNNFTISKQKQNNIPSVSSNKIESLFADLFGEISNKSPSHLFSPSLEPSPTKPLKEKILSKGEYIYDLHDDLYLSSSDESSCDNISIVSKENISFNEGNNDTQELVEKNMECNLENKINLSHYKENNSDIRKIKISNELLPKSLDLNKEKIKIETENDLSALTKISSVDKDIDSLKSSLVETIFNQPFNEKFKNITSILPKAKNFENIKNIQNQSCEIKLPTTTMLVVENYPNECTVSHSHFSNNGPIESSKAKNNSTVKLNKEILNFNKNQDLNLYAINYTNDSKRLENKKNSIFEASSQNSGKNEVMYSTVESNANITDNAVDEILKLFPQVKRTRNRRIPRQFELKSADSEHLNMFELGKSILNEVKCDLSENSKEPNNLNLKISPIISETCQGKKIDLKNNKRDKCKRRIFENDTICNKKLKEETISKLTKNTVFNLDEKIKILSKQTINSTITQKPLSTNIHEELKSIDSEAINDLNLNVASEVKVDVKKIEAVEEQNSKVLKTPKNISFLDNSLLLETSPIKECSFTSEKHLTKSTEKLIEECLQNDTMNLKYFNSNEENVEKMDFFPVTTSKACEESTENLKNSIQNFQINSNSFKSYTPASPNHKLEDSFNIVPILIPLEQNSELSMSDLKYSPASPIWQSDKSLDINLISIPLEREIENETQNESRKSGSLIESFLSIFDSQEQTKLFEKANQNKSKIQIELVTKLKNVLDHYVGGPATIDQVKKCIGRLLQNTQNSKIICKAITKVIEISKDRKKLNSTDSSLSMSETEAKIVVLIDKFNTHIKQFKLNLLTEIHNRIFTFKSESIQLENLINLIKFNIILMDLQNSNETEQNEDSRKFARLLIFKCFYYYHIKAIPMVFEVLISYPSVLPRKNNPFYKDDDPIIKAIQSILNSTPYNMLKTDLRHRETFYLLKDLYNYERVKPTREELVEFLIMQIRQNLLKDISYAFALICKQHGVEWTENVVIEKNILPLINEYYMKSMESNENDERIECLIESLSFILKAFPLDYENFEKYLQIFSNFLHLSTRKRVQQAAVCAILRTSRFGLVNTFTAISNWHPNFEVDKFVDIDKSLLELHINKVNPLLCDYLKRREYPLKIDIYEGSIDSPNDNLKNTDAVFAIELIEHLYPDVLENVPYNIFGFIEPKIAIFTTPNCEFNVLFDLNLPNGMRHPDHKFEWTRSQFRDWCQNICQRFPKYVVSVFGVGNGPPIKKRIGKVSQMAVFIRKDMVNIEIPMDIEFSKINLKPNEVISSVTKEYNLIHSIEYPFYEDKRTLHEKILDEAKYHINRCKTIEFYKKQINNIEKCFIPLDEIFYFTKQFSDSTEILKNILENNEFLIESNYIIVEPEEEFGRHGDDIDELLYGPDNSYYNNEDENYWNPETIDNENLQKETGNNQEPIPENVSECWD